MTDNRTRRSYVPSVGPAGNVAVSALPDMETHQKTLHPRRVFRNPWRLIAAVETQFTSGQKATTPCVASVQFDLFAVIYVPVFSFDGYEVLPEAATALRQKRL